VTDQNITTIPGQTQERWLPIPGFPGYDVSDQGRVRSYWRRVGLGPGNGSKFVLDIQSHKILKPGVSKLGYLIVHPKRDDGKRHNITVHKLVLITFVGPCPPGMEACHDNGKPANNDLTNLRWDTPKNNQADRHKHGTDYYPGPNCPVPQKGEANHSAKLTEIQVLEIRNLHTRGFPQVNIAKMFNVHKATINDIVIRKNWAHLP